MRSDERKLRENDGEPGMKCSDERTYCASGTVGFDPPKMAPNTLMDRSTLLEAVTMVSVSSCTTGSTGC